MVRIGARAAVLGALFLLAVGATTSAASAAGIALPDSRGYELVSPTAKNGVEVIPQTDKTHVRPDGNAVTFSALGGFGSVEGSGFDFEYLSRRTATPGTSGWSTHGINPLARPSTLGVVGDGNLSTYVNGFSPDLSVGVYKTWRPLVSAANAEDVTNLYRVTGLDGGPRTVQLLSDSVNPIPDSWFTFLNNGGFFLRQIQPHLAGASSDVRHVVFESKLRLTADAPAYPAGFCALVGGGCPTHLYENADGVVRLVGRIPQTGDTACDDSARPACVAAESSQAALSASTRFYSQLAVSADGRRVFFEVPGSGLYVREDGVRTELIAANGEFWTASADGSRAFFITSDSLVSNDTDSSADLYMYDLDRGTGSRLTLVSEGTSGIDGSVELVVGSSGDGRYVYFVCGGQLIAGESPDAFLGLYVWHDGQLRYVGTFEALGEAGMNGPRAAWTFPGSARTSRVTPDGRHLLFMATSDAGFAGRGGFTGYDHAGHHEFYLYNADTGRLACASCNPSGRAATTDALIDVRDNAATSQVTSDSAQALSDDGRRVFFNTAEALVPEDINLRLDPYEYDAQTGTVHLLSSGRSTAPSYFIDASLNGDDAFIDTRERLVGWDVDDSYDLYDARVAGGLPEPATPTPACAGEGCRGQSTLAPSADAFANPGLRGGGDAVGRLQRHRRCGRRAVLRKVRGKRRCVRRRSHRRAKRAESRQERRGQ